MFGKLSELREVVVCLGDTSKSSCVALQYFTNTEKDGSEKEELI